ncbi:hypothetical protein ABEB36_003304 [Hypothenemus hampei]|uniref:Uncharacterized protein n=1 Tax=Hypothenemus hampei TaxID=57062 RepID=A0ABD1F8P6_HYPHA
METRLLEMNQIVKALFPHSPSSLNKKPLVQKGIGIYIREGLPTVPSQSDKIMFDGNEHHTVKYFFGPLEHVTVL